MKYFITGIEGFVGHHLAEHLLSLGHEVSGSYFDSRGTIGLEDCRLFPADLRKGGEIRQVLEKVRPDCIFHLAAQSSPAISFERPVETFEINVIGLVNLLEAARNTVPDSRMMIISSCEVYGLSDADGPIKEDRPYSAASPYAVSKISQEQLALQYFRSYKMRTVVVRPFPHTGPGQPETFALPSFAKQIAGIVKNNSEPVVSVGNLSAQRDISDVRDIVTAYLMLAESGQDGEAYNVCSGKCITIKWALEKLIEFSGRAIEIRTDAQRFRPLDTPVLWGDNSKVRTRTGWQPAYGIDRTLRSLYQYWLDKK